MSSPDKYLPPSFLKNIEEVTYTVRGSQSFQGMEDFPFQLTIRAEKHRRLSFSIKYGSLHIKEEDPEAEETVKDKPDDEEESVKEEPEENNEEPKENNKELDKTNNFL